MISDLISEILFVNYVLILLLYLRLAKLFM